VSSLDRVLDEELAALEAAGLRRELRRWDGMHGPWIELDGARLSSFSSNNYLGLAAHPDLCRAAAAAMTTAGVGAGASRLIAGNHAEHIAFEDDLARFHRREAALLFNSGFQANLGVIPALVGGDDLVLSDRLNHASLIDGARLSRAKVLVYDHGNALHARRLLEETRREYRRCLLVTESVFSMDGDRAPLRDLSRLAADHDAWLMVDEAHAVGALGPRGQGICAELGVVPELLVGTLGKAFGSFGAYVTGTKTLRTFLLHQARSFVFTTALPPALIAAGRAALTLIAGPQGEHLRAALQDRIHQFRQGLEALHLQAPGAGTTPIFPIHIGPEAATLEVSRHLLAANIHAQAIRPPTVPRGTSRLRFALSATHDPTQVDQVLEHLKHLQQTGHLPKPHAP
jgi:8-amino-7-oxononanoate synthase